MVKVLNRDVDNQVFYRQLCEECRAELEYAFSDTHEGAFGLRYLICPACGKEIIAAQIDARKLNSGNIEFPKHFMGMSEDAVDITDEEVQTWVRKCLSVAEKSNEPYGYFIDYGCGNTKVILTEYEDEHVIIVAKDYYTVSISK